MCNETRINYAAIAEALDTEFASSELWGPVTMGPDNEPDVEYAGPTTPALAWAAFEPLVQGNDDCVVDYFDALRDIAHQKTVIKDDDDLAWWIAVRCAPTDRLLALQAALGIGGSCDG